MEIIDKQQNTQNSGSPQKQQNKTKTIVFLAVILIVCLGVIYAATQTSFGTGEPYAVQVSGLTVLPGKTTVQELTDAGFNLSDYRVNNKKSYDITAKAEPKTRYQLISLMKNEKMYAHINILNASSAEKPLSECIVSHISFTNGFDYADNDKILINTAPLKDISLEKMTKLSGKPFESKPYKTLGEKEEKGTEHIWKMHAYELHVIILEDGTVYKVSSSYEP